MQLFLCRWLYHATAQGPAGTLNATWPWEEEVSLPYARLSLSSHRMRSLWWCSKTWVSADRERKGGSVTFFSVIFCVCVCVLGDWTQTSGFPNKQWMRSASVIQGCTFTLAAKPHTHTQTHKRYALINTNVFFSFGSFSSLLSLFYFDSQEVQKLSTLALPPYSGVCMSVCVCL